MLFEKACNLAIPFFDTKNERGDINGGKFDVPGKHMLDLKFKF